MKAARKVGKDKWERLFDLAREFNMAKPWELFSDIDLFALRRPSNGDIVFPLILGNASSFYGMSIYLGKFGLLHYSLAQSEMEPDNPAFTAMYDSLLLSFMERMYLEKDDLELPGVSEVTLNRAKVWPQFRRMGCMRLNSRISRSDADLLIEVIPLVLDVVSLAREQPALMSIFDDTPLPLFEKTGAASWVTTDMDDIPNNLDILQPGDLVSDIDRKRLAGLERETTTWQLGWKIAPALIGNDPKDMASVAIIQILDKGECRVRQYATISPSRHEHLWLDFWKEFMSMLGRERSYPAELEVSDPWIRELIEPLKDHLDIRIVERDYLPEMEKAFNFVFDAMGWQQEGQEV